MSEPETGSGSGPRPDEKPSLNDVAGSYAERSGIERRDDGQIDVLKSVGGIRGLAEAIIPGLAFLVLFTVTRDLQTALIFALGAAAIFTVVRLIQRTSSTQAFSGLIGVGICALVANTTGQAEDFYVVGFITNAAYIAGMLISLAVKWPIAGLLFGFIRGEGTAWRSDPARLKVYNIATWILISVMALRLIVQVPLYLLGEQGLIALGTSRLLMGVPLYALGLWIAWLISRPRPVESPEPTTSFQQ